MLDLYFEGNQIFWGSVWSVGVGNQGQTHGQELVLGFSRTIPGWKGQLRGLWGGSGAVSPADGPSPGNRLLAHG